MLLSGIEVADNDVVNEHAVTFYGVRNVMDCALKIRYVNGGVLNIGPRIVPFTGLEHNLGLVSGSAHYELMAGYVVQQRFVIEFDLGVL